MNHLNLGDLMTLKGLIENKLNQLPRFHSNRIPYCDVLARLEMEIKSIEEETEQKKDEEQFFKAASNTAGMPGGLDDDVFDM